MNQKQIKIHYENITSGITVGLALCLCERHALHSTTQTFWELCWTTTSGKWQITTTIRLRLET